MQQTRISLQVIQGGAGRTLSLVGNTTMRQLLMRVLKARLTPTLTVEQASHLNSPDLAGNLPSMETFLADLTLLRSAGLDAHIQFDDIPEGIVLIDPERFKARFPELALAIPAMLTHGGVQPYTEGLPRHAPALSVV